jgi:hypothetical protein
MFYFAAPISPTTTTPRVHATVLAMMQAGGGV